MCMYIIHALCNLQVRVYLHCCVAIEHFPYCRRPSMKQAFLHFGRNQTKARLKPEKNTKHVVSDQ